MPKSDTRKKCSQRPPKDKGHAPSYLILAQQHHLAGKLSQAETVYNEILKAEPNNPDAIHLLGVLCHQAGNVNNAVELILKALSGHPNFPEAYNNLGNAYIDLDQFQEAIDSYNLALGIRPGYKVARNNLCRPFTNLATTSTNWATLKGPQKTT